MDRRQLLTSSLLAASAVTLGATIDPADSHATSSVLGWISIPRIRLHKPVYADTHAATLKRGGLGHWLGTAAPGDRGNCILFGHRSTSGAPLRAANLIRRGDTIRIAGTTYRAESILIVRATDITKILDWNPGRHKGLQLVACSRPDGKATSLTHRIIVRATV